MLDTFERESRIVENTEKIEHYEGEPNGHFNCYYAFTNLETEDDVDCFRVKVIPGNEYVAVLKNVWLGQVRDMEVKYQNASGAWVTVTARENQKKERQTIIHFTPGGETCYIKISGKPASGYKHDSATNWFAVELDGTIDERPLVGSKKPSCSLQ